MKVLLKADGQTAAGGSPLIMHNERLADPLDQFTRAIAGIAKKRNKTEADHEEIGRLEFLGGLYTDPPLALNGNTTIEENGYKPCLPAWNVLRCLQDGAKRHKRGVDVLRGVYPLAQEVKLIYSGPVSPNKLWTDGRFVIRKTVGVQRSRTMRTRPLFSDWRCELPVEVDPLVFDLDTLRTVWRDAGVYAGIGDMRPIHGRFKATIEEMAK